MIKKKHYRLTTAQKNDIAFNMIEVLEQDVTITEQSRHFITEWILTDSADKTKAFYDVWDIILKNYLPTSRPILFRSSKRICKNGKIASFTGRFESARRFSEEKGALILCDTSHSLITNYSSFIRGNYKNTFYPLVDVLKKAQQNNGWGFSKRFLCEYIGEDEYIMRINFDRMHCMKWVCTDNE